MNTCSALLSSRRLPQLNLVAFRVNDPAELPVFRVVELVQYIATFFPEGLEQRAEVGYSVVHHEGGRAWRKSVILGRPDGPDRCSAHRLAICVCPAEGGASPVLDVDAKVLLVPSLHCLRVFGFKEDATNTCNAVHVYLTQKVEQVRDFDIRRSIIYRYTTLLVKSTKSEQVLRRRVSSTATDRLRTPPEANFGVW